MPHHHSKKNLKLLENVAKDLEIEIIKISWVIKISWDQDG